jgi:transitional endoplasmic reticulum ATPase
MGRELQEIGPVAHVAQIVYSGEKMILPEGMGLDEAMNLLQRRKAYLEEQVAISRVFNVFPWDGAHAVMLALNEKYGWANMVPTPGFFGPEPPQLMSIDVGFNKKVEVAWGAFSLPGVVGRAACSAAKEGGVWKFKLDAAVLRKDEATVRDLFNLVEQKCRENSIYRGKAIKIRFRDANGKPLQMPEPKFLDTDSVEPDKLVYSDSVMRSIQTNLFTPIQRVHDCLLNGLPVKRGVLLGGIFGTGKTLAAYVASKYAVENGNTFIYVPRADELPDAIAFAMQYQSPAAVIFCEDIDRAAAGQRTVTMDDLLNIIDGIDTKRANIITVLTTNAMENINPAMIRPGRLDAVINVTPPDAKAVEKLIRIYGGDAVDPNADLTRAGEALKGNIPAVIAEAVKRAKLAQLYYQPRGTKLTNISEQAIVDAAESLAHQLTLLNRAEPEAVPTFESIMQDVLAPIAADAKKAGELAKAVMEKVS